MNASAQPISEIIKKRHSVRSYENGTLPEEARERLQAYLDEINHSKGPFGGKVRISLIQRNDTNKEIKLGTYGVIKGATNFLTVACKKNDDALVDLGFLFEKVILFCTALGLGTVWMGGTFSKGNFAKAMQLKEDELMPIVSPVGVEGAGKSFIATMIAKSNLSRRNDFSQLFFNGNFNTPLTYEAAGEYGDVLEMVRLAPSALNKQPWRILKQENKYHFYSVGNHDVNKIDLGIGLCHFYLSAMEKGLKGEIKVLSLKSDGRYKYVASWVE